MTTALLARITAVALLCLPLSGLPQTIPAPAQAGKKTALYAFKNGDGATGLSALRSNTDHGASGRSADAQVVDQLTEISFWMLNEGHPRTVETVTLAISEAEKTKGKLVSAEEAEVSVTIGRLSEKITGDIGKAKASYEAALRSNPKNDEAAKGLARIKRLEDLVAAKSRENEALRLRKLQQPKS